jgi:hypothetical protein
LKTEYDADVLHVQPDYQRTSTPEIVSPAAPFPGPWEIPPRAGLAYLATNDPGTNWIRAKKVLTKMSTIKILAA